MRRTRMRRFGELQWLHRFPVAPRAHRRLPEDTVQRMGAVRVIPGGLGKCIEQSPKGPLVQGVHTAASAASAVAVEGYARPCRSKFAGHRIAVADRGKMVCLQRGLTMGIRLDSNKGFVVGGNSGHGIVNLASHGITDNPVIFADNHQHEGIGRNVAVLFLKNTWDPVCKTGQPGTLRPAVARLDDQQALRDRQTSVASARRKIAGNDSAQRVTDKRRTPVVAPGFLPPKTPDRTLNCRRRMVRHVGGRSPQRCLKARKNHDGTAADEVVNPRAVESREDPTPAMKEYHERRRFRHRAGRQISPAFSVALSKMQLPNRGVSVDRTAGTGLRRGRLS